MPLFDPTSFQGVRRKRRYFEGWYFKQVSPRGDAWAFIPGVSMNADGSKRLSFVQAIDGSTGRTLWYEFPFESFRWGRRPFHVRIAENRFSLEGLDLSLDGPEGRIDASLRFGPLAPFPSRPWRPGIMGPYSFAPFLECNHGLVSLDHVVDGSVEAEGKRHSMDGGRGYIEKDWGSSMPSAWIWSQSNSFSEPGVSFMFSLANIPWLGGSFPGFLCAANLPGIRRGGPSVRVWATWNGAKIVRLNALDTLIDIEIRRKAETLRLSLERGSGGLLRAPASGSMERRISESVDAVMRVRLEDSSGVLYEGKASPSGLEIVGDLSTLG